MQEREVEPLHLSVREPNPARLPIPPLLRVAPAAIANLYKLYTDRPRRVSGSTGPSRGLRLKDSGPRTLRSSNHLTLPSPETEDNAHRSNRLARSRVPGSIVDTRRTIRFHFPGSRPPPRGRWRLRRARHVSPPGQSIFPGSCEGAKRWLAPSPCSPASGPTCRSTTSAPRPRSSATTASSWPAGATTSRSTRPSKDKNYCKGRWEILQDHGLQVLRDLQPPGRAGDLRQYRRAAQVDPARRTSGATASPKASASGPRSG